MSDDDLLRRVARFDPEPFAVLYDRHSVVAFSLARRMVGAPGAEDVVQEAFLQVWRGAGAYDPARGTPRTWLLSLVRNRSIDALRKLGVHARHQVEAQGFEERLAGPDSVEDQALRTERSVAVRTALASLPPEQREVLELAYFGGRTQVEIAERLGLPLGTVKGRTSLGLGKLRGELAASMDVSG